MATASRRQPLRAVESTERRSARAASPKSKLVSQVEMSERETLVILRRKVATQIDDGAPVHALANLIRQFRQIDHDIRALDAAAEEPDSEDGDDSDGSAEFDADAI
jgi:hypothetical protein